MPFPFAKGTFSRFSRKTREPSTQAGTLPAVQEPIVPTRDTKATAQTDKDKLEQDVDKINEALQPQPLPTRQQLHAPENKAHEGQANTEPRTTTQAELGQENIYAIMWRPEADYRLVPVRHPRTNTFYPSSIPMFKLLDAAEKRINLSKHIQTHEITYMPYAVKVYYGIMFYIQILRAKKAAGHLEGYEASLLNRFQKKYSDESLPCAEILYGYFNTIASTELADAKYDWITPDIGQGQFKGTTNPVVSGFDTAQISANGIEYLQPQIPFMMAMLNNFIHHDPDTIIAQVGSNLTYVPVDLAPAQHADVTVFGQTFRDNTNTRNDFKPMLQTAGTSSLFRFGNSNYQEAKRYALDTDFGNTVKIVVSTATTDGTVGLAEAYPFPSLDEFLFMQKGARGTSNLKWFGYLREQAIIHARFFDQVYHFNDVQDTCGLETSVLCKLKLEGETAPDCYYHDLRCGMTQAAHWYVNPFNDLNGGFATSRSGVRRNEELQALAYGTNATLPIIIRNAANTAITNAQRPIPDLTGHGKLWENSEWTNQLNWNNNLVAGKPMYSDMNSQVLRCYREKPHGTGVVDNML